MLLPFKKRIIAAALLIAGLNSRITLAQDNKFLTLTEAVNLCRQNNKHLKLSYVKVEAATAAIAEARDRRLPDVGASASYLRLTKPRQQSFIAKGSTIDVAL